MLQEYKRKTNINIGLGLLLALPGIVMSYGKFNDTLSILGGFIWTIGFLFIVYGCCMYAKGKGHSALWGILAFGSLIGWIILYFLKDLHKNQREE